MIPGDSSFELGYGIMPHQGKIVTLADAPDGKNVLEFTGDLISYDTFSLKSGKNYTLSLWLRSGKKTRVSIQAFATNWKVITSRSVETGPEWKRYALVIPPQKFGSVNTCWLRLVPSDKKSPVLADALQLDEGENATEYQSAEPVNLVCRVLSPVAGNLFLQGEKAQFQIGIRNNQKKTVRRELKVMAADYFGQKQLEETRNLDLTPNETRKLVFSLPESSRKGFYMVRCTLSGDGPAVTEKASFCILAPPVPRDKSKRSLFGASWSPPETIPAMSRIGVKAMTMPVRWQGKKGGTVSFSSQVANMLDHGIEPVLLLRRTPSWAILDARLRDTCPPKDEFRADYGDFAYQVAKTYKGKVRAYQLWGGETDLQSQWHCQVLGKSPDWYIKLLGDMCKYGYQGIKKADPDAVVQSPAVSGVDCHRGSFPWQKKVLAAAKGFYDEAVIHPYCYPSRFEGNHYVQSPEENDLVSTYRQAIRISGRKTVMNGEYGFEISAKEALDSPASRQMADYLIRSYLLSAESGAVSHVMNHTLISVSRNADNFSSYSWPNPRPAIAAYSAMAQLFTYADTPERFDLSSVVRGLLMRSSKNKQIGALWVPENKDIPFVVNSSAIVFYDFMGNPVRGKEIRLSGSPVFFETSKSRKELKSELLSGKLRIQNIAAEGKIISADKIRIFLKNQIQNKLSGQLEIKYLAEDGRMYRETEAFTDLRPGVQETVTVSLKHKLALNEKPIAGTVKTGNSALHFTISTEISVCPRIPAPIRIDGDLSKWMNNPPAIVLEGTQYVFPPDAFSHGMWTGNSDLSVRVWFGWDPRYFYFAMRVLDDKHLHNGGRVFHGDCIQLAFDSKNNALSKGYKSDDYEFNFALSEKGELYHSQTWPLPVTVPKKIRFAAKRSEKTKTTDYEIAIPFELLRHLKPVSGNVFGFNFVALDADIKHRVNYWMGLTYGICGGKDPSVFKKFILSDKP